MSGIGLRTAVVVLFPNAVPLQPPRSQGDAARDGMHNHEFLRSRGLLQWQGTLRMGIES